MRAWPRTLHSGGRGQIRSLSQASTDIIMSAAAVTMIPTTFDCGSAGTAEESHVGVNQNICC